MTEINKEHIPGLKILFGENANIKCTNFLGTSDTYDMIIGNPPFNSEGLVKVPTNTKSRKKKDGVSIWKDFIQKAVQNLRDGGQLIFITPSIWMKSDHSLHQYMMRYDVQKNPHNDKYRNEQGISRARANPYLLFYSDKRTQAAHFHLRQVH